MKGFNIVTALDDEIFYGGESVPVGDPTDQPNEANVVSDMFFVAEGSIVVTEFEAIVTRPTRLEGMTEPKVFFVATCKGRINNQNKLGAFTMIMEPPAMRAFLKSNRELYTRIPLEYRGE